ncbi:MAG: WYL domain-containing protein [Anaerolineae bacterium]|nr:WYL domain-containing protein [Anaerolineae bacterium]
MIHLCALLSERTHRELEAVAGAYGLPFTRRQPKHIGLQNLAHTLPGKPYRRAFRHLTDADRIALRSLQAAGGRMSLHRFQRIFGGIRAYKPWRDDSPRHPWRHPVSTAEKLFHLAFIGIVEREIVLTDEVSTLLPPLPRPNPVMWNGQTPPSPRAALLTDVAAVLGTLLYEPVQPQWKRWLPPRALKAINARLRSPDDLAQVRSELQSGRIRFLHYLAAQSRLLSLQVGSFQPTPLAWRWLEWTPENRWRFLVDCIEPDGDLWRQFRLPATSKLLWSALIRLLKTLPTGCAYHIADLAAALMPYVPEETDLEAKLDHLLQTVLTWMGWVSVVDGCCYLTVPDFPAEERAVITAESDALYISLPALSPASALVHLLSVALPAEGVLRIDADTVRGAVGKGYNAPDLVRILAQLQGTPLPQATAQRLHRWAQTADALSLQPMLVLTARDAEIITHLQSDWRLRQHLGTRLSPHHIAVQPDSASHLLKRLKRRQHPVTTTLHPRSARQTRDQLDADTLEYLWLAARTYQKLSTVVDPPVRIPGALLDWLAGQLPPGATTPLDTTAQQVVERLALVSSSRTAPTGQVAQDDPDGISDAVQQAYDQRSALTIDYYSPYRGETTTRTIEPIALYHQNGAQYVEAWCRLEADSRTFRVDRILRVHPPDANTSPA